MQCTLVYLLFPPPTMVGVSRLYWDGRISDWPGPIAGLKFTPWGPIPFPSPPITWSGWLLLGSGRKKLYHCAFGQHGQDNIFWEDGHL